MVLAVLSELPWNVEEIEASVRRVARRRGARGVALEHPWPVALARHRPKTATSFGAI